MTNPLFNKNLSTTLKVSLEPVELIKHPDVLNKYYCLVQPLLMDALTEAYRIVERLEGLDTSLLDDINASSETIDLIRTCDYRLYKTLFELTHAVKEIQTKKYTTKVDGPPIVRCLLAIAQWNDHFIPEMERLFLKLTTYEYALINAWEAYEHHADLFYDKKFTKARRSISLQFTKSFSNSLEELLQIIEESKINVFDIVSEHAH